MNANQIFRLGTGCGIEIRGADLRVVAVRSRRAGVQVLGHCGIAGFRERPAAEWGAELRAFLEDLHLSHLSATVVLPRDEVIVREIRMPALGKKELAAAVGYELENLHPFDPGEIYHAFAPLGSVGAQNASLPLAVVIAERTKVDAYADLFENAGIAVESFTVAAAAFFGAVRVRWDAPPVPFVIADYGSEGLEIYGEGTGRALLSTRFDLSRIPAQRALSLAGADLRLETDQAAKLIRVGDSREQSDAAAEPAESFELCRVEELLPVPTNAPIDFDAANLAAAFAAGLDAACPRLGWNANLLPAERRKKNSRWMYLPTAALAAACLLLTLGFPLRVWIQDGGYVQAIEAETARLSLTVQQVDALDAEARESKQKFAVLEALDQRTGADLRILSELSDLLPATVWLSSLEMDDEGVRIQGTAAGAAPLLGMVNEAVNLTEAEFSASIVTTKDGTEQFRMAARRRMVEQAPDPLSPSAPVPVSDESEPDAEGGALSTLGEDGAAEAR